MRLVVDIERGARPGPSPAGADAPVSQDAAAGEAQKDSDAVIVAAVLTGETQRFGELVKRYSEMVATFAYVRTRNRDLAEEIAQETMVRAYEKLWSLKVPRHFSHWLFGIANNVALQAAQKARRSAAVSLEDLELGGGRSPGDEAASRELWSRLVGQVDALDPRYKVPFVMKHQEGLSCEEIAERLGLPEGTVRGRLSRAYGILRKRLAAEQP